MPPVQDAVVWLPAGLPTEHFADLPRGATLREIPPEPDAVPDHPGRGDVVIPHVRRSILRRLLPRLENLRLVQTLSAGVDIFVDLVPPGVTLCDAQGVHDVAVSEWVMAGLLAMQRDLPTYVRQQDAATWQSAEAREVQGMRVLIVGHGSIGRAVAARLRPFGAHVEGVALHPRDDAHPVGDLDSLLPDADAVVVLLPLTERTRGMVGRDFIARMKPGALLLNAGRGPVADTEAITEAVQQGRIRAVLDVTDPEPLPADHPLWRERGVLITPHVGGQSDGMLDRGLRLAAAQVRRHIEGEPLLNVVSEGY